MNENQMNVNGDQQPQGNGYQQPAGNDYGQPGSQQPAPNSYGQPNYQQPAGNGYGQPNYQQSAGNNYGQPGYQQPNYRQPQQNMYQVGNPQMQGGYQNGANYNNGQYEKDPRESTGFGIASLVLGIIALVLFCTGCNVLLAVLAIIFGIIQLVRSNYKGMAIGGIITAGLSVIFFVIYWIVVGSTAINYSDIYDNYYYYDSYDDYSDLYEELLEQYEDF